MAQVQMYLPEPQKQCSCHENDPPPWTGEIHGLSQALLSETKPMKAFWWLVMAVCIICGTTTTTLVILEYIDGPTATSTTIRLVDSLELPALTVCPKVPDSFNQSGIMGDIKGNIPDIDMNTSLDLLRFWIGGSGLENMDPLGDFNRTYLGYLNNLFKIWSRGYSTLEFFNLIWRPNKPECSLEIHDSDDKYGYKCEELFYDCQLAGKVMDCCSDLFEKQWVMRRGLCFQTRAHVNQTEADDIGRLILSIKATTSVTNPSYNYTQPQMVVYITDNYVDVVDFPRYYLYENEWNRMRFTARYIELIQNKAVCTNQIFGRDAQCLIRKWLLSNIVYPFNCTLPYLTDISNLPPHNGICPPSVIADSYYNNVQLVWNSAHVTENCIPGCKRWDYQIALQQSQTLTPFKDYTFNLEVSFNDLQYEYVKEVYTTSVPGFMSQIGGQFGFFLGLSIITLMQMLLYGAHYVLSIIAEKLKGFYRISRSSLQESLPEIDLPQPGYPPSLRDNEDAVITTTHRKREEDDGISIITRTALDSDGLSERSTSSTASVREEHLHP